uniref:Complement component C6 n=1 Tax=Lepisosteus oculatus TaxID=7918 RepID=W5MMN5_LEPOC
LHCAMDGLQPLFILLTFIWHIRGSLGCLCDRYPWTAWTSCSKTCNYGTQTREREKVYDDYYHKNYCSQLCTFSETRACNQEACPINCLLGDYGLWSQCSPCARKKFRTRHLLRPTQFKGQPCSEILTEERNCYPTELCSIKEMDCSTKFSCKNGRCIPQTLECNDENDCGDRSDEEYCAGVKKVCNQRFETIPNVQLMGSGFDIMAEEIRGEVLDNTFYGGQCNLTRSKDRKFYRLPANIENVVFKVEKLEDYKIESEPDTNPVNLASEQSTSSSFSGTRSEFRGIPLLFSKRTKQNSWGSSFFRTAVKASQKKDSKFFRVHHVVGVSSFRMKSSDLYLSDPFLRALNSLPLDYNYALYIKIFQLFGTHYFSSGTLGGRYDILYQYDREELKNSGFTDSEATDCIRSETSRRIFFFKRTTVRTKCITNKMSERYEGSFLKASEKYMSMVVGGRAEYAAALAWEKKGVLPEDTVFKNWMESTKDNPVFVEYELTPILKLVRGIPCALTKRRNLEKALVEYLEDFDSCKCAPCPNNAKPVLSGTECLCICQSGTYGDNCEKRAPDYTSDAVDGYWSCWAPWSTCDSSTKRKRTRQCNNPSPLLGGKPCEGDSQEEEECFISIFQQKAECIHDNEGEKETDVPPEKGKSGCSRPNLPENSYLRINKKRYDFGEHDEFVCVTGFELDGYPYTTCLPDGTWKMQSVQCIKKTCSRPAVPSEVSISPFKEDYSIGESIFLSCGLGLTPSGPSYFECRKSLSWEPSFPSQIICETEKPFVSDGSCKLGEKQSGSTCVCMSPTKDCQSYREDICVLDVQADSAVMKSSCAFHAGRCQGEQLHFLKTGACDNDELSLNWAKFRASLSDRSEKKESCGYNTCYEWETCTDSKCECLRPYECPKEGKHIFCVETVKSKTKRTSNLCFLGAMKCAAIQMNILHDGEC